MAHHPWSLSFYQIIIIISICSIGLITSSVSSSSPDHDQNHEQQQQQQTDFLWKKILELPDELFEKIFIPSYVDWNNDVLHNDNISVICKNQINHAMLGIKERKTWAFKLFNSWARSIPNGIVTGTLTDYGDYDQCINIDPNKIIAQYCLVDIAFPMPYPMPKHHNLNRMDRVIPSVNETSIINTKFNKFVSEGTIFRDLADYSSLFYYAFIRMGICLPNDCSQADIQLIATKGLKNTGLNLKSITCTTKNLKRWIPNMAQMIAIIFLVSLMAVTISAALYDRAVTNKSNTLSETILLWFSPIRNVNKLLSTKSNDELTCIHGIRFITLIWVIIGHTLEWNPFNIWRQSFMIRDRLSSLEYQPLVNAHFSVDTFFYMSGLLTSYVTFKYTQGDFSKFRFVPYILLRYLRLTPQLVAFLLLLSLLPSMFDGPLWSSYMQLIMDKCSITWWHNLLYLQNWIDVENICGIHTWYLASDMQLHWISIVLIAILLKYQDKGILITKILTLACISISAITLFFKKLPPGTVITTKNDFLDLNGKPRDFIKFFWNPWNHANVFFIGFIFGSKIYHNSHRYKVMRLKKSVKYFYWLVAFLGYISCIYSTTPWLWGRPYDPFWSALIFPLSRTIWALMMTLVIWLCITNNGTFIGRFLSWPGFRPLSRMTYSVYLTHVLVFYIALGSRRNLVDMRMISISLMLVSCIIVSYCFGFFFTVLFETPLIHFLEYLKNSVFMKTSNNNNNENLLINDSKKQISSSVTPLPPSSIINEEKKQFLASSNNHNPVESNV